MTKIKEGLSGKIKMLMKKKMELAKIFTLISFGIFSYYAYLMPLKPFKLQIIQT
jgi:hypothetical protein